MSAAPLETPERPGEACPACGRPPPPASIIPWAAQPDKGNLKRSLVLQWSRLKRMEDRGLRARGRPEGPLPRAGDAPSTPLALRTGPGPGNREPERRGVSGVLCLALVFYSFLLIINDTDLSRGAISVSRAEILAPPRVSSWLPGGPRAPGRSLRTPAQSE